MGDVFGKAPSPPPAPNYTAAAQATAAGNLDAARAAASANRVNQVTPYGTLNYTQTPVPGNPDAGWTATTTLAPDQQKLLDIQNQTSLGLGSLANQGTSYVQNTLNKPFDWQGINANTPGGQSGQAGWDNAYNSIVNRAQPQFQADQSRLENQLANQGITKGSEAYTNAQRGQDQKYNDFLLGAQNQATGQQQQQFNMGQQARQQAIQEQTFARNEPLNMLNAVRTGSQVTNPTFGGVPQQGQTAGPDLMGAANSQNQYNMGLYNSQVGSQNSLMSGLFGLGSAAIKVSDRRLKRNIKHIGKHNGINIYSFDYVWGQPSVGVMADEVEHIPGAVHIHSSGYKMVDYSKLG